MSGHLAQHGVDVALEAFSPTGDAPQTHPSILEKRLKNDVYHFAMHGDDENLVGQAGDQRTPQPKQTATGSGLVGSA